MKILRLGQSLCSSGSIGGAFSKYSCLFDGIDAHVRIEDSALLRPESALTVSFWVRPSSWTQVPFGVEQFMIGCVKSGGWGVYLTKQGGNSYLRFRIRVSDIDPACSGSAQYLTAEVGYVQTEALPEWVNVVARYENGRASLRYNTLSTGTVDGIGCPSATIVYHPSPVPVFIGADSASPTSASNFFEGNIDEVAIFNTSLTVDDYTSIYNDGSPGDISAIVGLQGWWRMGDPNGQASFPTLIDNSVNENDGTMTDMIAADIETVVP